MRVDCCPLSPCISIQAPSLEPHLGCGPSWATTQIMSDCTFAILPAHCLRLSLLPPSLFLCLSLSLSPFVCLSVCHPLPPPITLQTTSRFTICGPQCWVFFLNKHKTARGVRGCFWTLARKGGMKTHRPPNRNVCRPRKKQKQNQQKHPECAEEEASPNHGGNEGVCLTPPQLWRSVHQSGMSA